MPDELYAYVVLNTKLKREQIISGRIGDVVAPVYAWTLKELDDMRPFAEAVAKQFGISVKVVMFEKRRDLEVIYPPGMHAPKVTRRPAKRAGKK